MDQSALADRRRLRRKLTFWRVLTLLVIVGLGFAVYRMGAGEGGRATPHVAQVRISGMIQDDKELLERLDRIAESDSAKALVVSISSPGGTTYGGERIFKAIRAVAEKKPVVSDIRTLAASAGYMVATAGDTIVAGESSITGSIGVIFQYPQIAEMMDNLGISLEEIKSSPLKAEPSPFHPPSEEARAMIRSMIMDSYDWFVDLVAARRNLSRDEALRLSDGSIFTGRQALQARLVDTLGGDDEIRAFLAGKGVGEDLPMVEWKGDDGGSSLWFARAMAEFVRLTGLADLIAPASLRPWVGEKLFLDGLVSVWQVGRK
ncbi:signal peptide peptidase SppA [Pseudorhizobium endolithicum]|uniref:Signal peptide peptidase SppA n=1 Tax=Pseudorhizobium endolithicum TaxID=1191678 RepID=A0ABM8PM48_9HYPH|nr:signal peptide peptidase SppA [Pseudorhizobium endolithicum]CAD7037428.1 signal peptide peptidase SppA [Pseudorhizobium endolithicum]